MLNLVLFKKNKNRWFNMEDKFHEYGKQIDRLIARINGEKVYIFKISININGYN